MLKIKDNVDLKELEKFGFEHIKDNEDFDLQICYYTEHYVYDKGGFSVYIPLEKIYFGKRLRFIPRQIIMDGIDHDLFDLPEIIFDLIQAGLVEKV